MKLGADICALIMALAKSPFPLKIFSFRSSTMMFWMFEVFTLLMIPLILFLNNSHISFWCSSPCFSLSIISLFIWANLWGATYTPPALVIIFSCFITSFFGSCCCFYAFSLYISFNKFGCSFKASIKSPSGISIFSFCFSSFNASFCFSSFNASFCFSLFNASFCFLSIFVSFSFWF